MDPALLMSVNYFGAVALVEGLRPQLAAADGAAVVFLASNSITGQPGWDSAVAGLCLRGDEAAVREAASRTEAVMVYPASKAALAWWARREGVKPEWIGAGIRMNSVAPGKIATPMVDQLMADPVFGPLSEAYPSAIGRDGRADEVAAVIAFLLSDEASLVVGRCSTSTVARTRSCTRSPPRAGTWRPWRRDRGTATWRRIGWSAVVVLTAAGVLQWWLGRPPLALLAASYVAVLGLLTGPLPVRVAVSAAHLVQQAVLLALVLVVPLLLDGPLRPGVALGMLMAPCLGGRPRRAAEPEDRRRRAGAGAVGPGRRAPVSAARSWW